MAYASKRYNSLKAHEYYERYRKRGVKKGRDVIAGSSSRSAKKKQAVTKLKTEMQERVGGIRKRIKTAKELTEDGVLSEEIIESFKDEIEDLRLDIKQKYNQIKKESKGPQKLANVKLDKRYELY